MTNYPDDVNPNDPRAPWNETDRDNADAIIDDLDGKDLFNSGNWDLDGTLDAFDGRIRFDVPALYAKGWDDLTDEERAAFDTYAAAVRAFASLYERGTN